MGESRIGGRSMNPQTISGVAAITILVLLVRLGRLLRTQRASLAERPGVKTHPKIASSTVSVLIPARNEARCIRTCVMSVLEQGESVREIIVLNDNSEDDTENIVSSISVHNPRVRVLRANHLPAGWTGKCNALHQLANAATGEVLLFLDADTKLRPGAIDACVHHFERLGLDALSCLGERVQTSTVEKMWEPVWPIVLFLLVGPLDRAGLRESQVNFASGAWFLIRRTVYDAIGGHAAIRNEVVEDCALAGRIKQAGFNMAIADAPELYELRMYSTARELWAGWSKNAFRLITTFLRRTRRTAVVVVAIILLATVLPFVPAFLAVIGAAPELSLFSAYGPAALALAASLAIRLATRRHAFYFWSLPIGGLLAASVLVYSAACVLSGRGVVWKGRHYA